MSPFYHIFCITFISYSFSFFEDRIETLVMYRWEKCTMTLTLWLFLLSNIIIFPHYLYRIQFSCTATLSFSFYSFSFDFPFYSIFLRCYFFFLFASTQLNSSQLQSFSTNKKVHKNICEGFVHNRIKITKFSSKRKTENKTGAKTTVFFVGGNPVY